MMYLFELFDEPGSDSPTSVPLLPIFGTTETPPFQTLVKLGLTTPTGKDGFMLSWAAVCAAIVGNTNSLYREVRPIIAESPNPQLATKYAIDALTNRNFYKYRAMRDIIESDYDPIANYDMTEITTTEYNGGHTISNTQTTDTVTVHSEDAATDTTVYGATTNTTAVDAAVDTSQTPQTTVTTNRGATTGKEITAAVTTTEELAHDVFGYNSPATAQAESKDTKTLTAPEQTTTQTTDAATDTVTTNAVTVTNNLGARNATVSDAEHTDTVNRGERSTRDTQRAGDTAETMTYNDRKDVTTVERTGNIGVTTSQQLLMSELQLRRATEYINMLATDVVNALTIGVYGLGGM